MTNVSPLLQFTNYWRQIYSDTNPRARLVVYDHIELQEVMRRMDSRHFPEPFYGLWDDDLSRDGVLLLINPGQVPFDDHVVERINQDVQVRYSRWTKAEYLHHDSNSEQKSGDIGLQWRLRRKQQAERILGDKLDFLHIIEYFPYHSKSWATLSAEAKHYVAKLQSTRLALDAVIDIATNHKARFVFGIGQPWAEVLKMQGYELHCEELSKPGSKRFSHRFYWTKVTATALTIIIYVSGAGGMNLPTMPEAVAVIRRLLRE